MEPPCHAQKHPSPPAVDRGATRRNFGLQPRLVSKVQCTCRPPLGPLDLVPPAFLRPTTHMCQDRCTFIGRDSRTSGRVWPPCMHTMPRTGIKLRTQYNCNGTASAKCFIVLLFVPIYLSCNQNFAVPNGQERMSGSRGHGSRPHSSKAPTPHSCTWEQRRRAAGEEEGRREGVQRSAVLTQCTCRKHTRHTRTEYAQKCVLSTRLFIHGVFSAS